ncbi:GNAT family N-acetyltransferase [Phycicoccus sp. CSK15P-2]|uniref:GNAT family N-acetyltransferase n=1 Tax=Phycicoccus sp. CSK15P-2 TaxID=2807627 RepID=UPI00194E56D2|nr:GNAT family N-acetyltransferase [Phycicoccus sp. CSK15P-2]MBM6405673.1 GNAT family N-acetyltransferase [Phycicoccus sp. CSK15P-2]
MDARVAVATTPEELAVAGRLLHEFNTAHDDPSPGPDALAARLAVLVARDTDVLLGDEEGVAVVRYRPSLWAPEDEAYLAELWVDPSARGTGLGRALLRGTLERARERGCPWFELSTSEDDVAARALYESEGLHATEGVGGPVAYHYEIDL